MKRSLIVSALRLLWLRSPERTECVKSARVARGKYRCKLCKKEFKRNMLQVDHIDPVGKFVDWNTFVSRLFCPTTNLQAICAPCHLKKTNKDSK